MRSRLHPLVWTSPPTNLANCLQFPWDFLGFQHSLGTLSPRQTKMAVPTASHFQPFPSTNQPINKMR